MFRVFIPVIFIPTFTTFTALSPPGLLLFAAVIPAARAVCSAA